MTTDNSKTVQAEWGVDPLEGVEGAQFLPADEKVNVSKKRLADYY